VGAAATEAELLELATEQARHEDEAGLAATLDAVAERFPELDDPLLAARFVELSGTRVRGEEGLEKWARAAAMYADAGDESQGIVLRARLALARAYSGDVDPEPIRAAVDHLEEHGDVPARASAWTRLSIMHMIRQEVAEALAADDRAYEYATRSGDPLRVAQHAAQRARIRANADDTEAAREAARVAWEFYRGHGPRQRLAEVATLYGQLLDDPAMRVEAFGSAIACGVTEEELPARVGRGRALKQLGRADEAVADLVEAVALCAEQGLDEGGGYARYELAEAYAMAGRAFEAAEVAEEALVVFDEHDQVAEADDTRFLLARQYREIGDTSGAVARYRELIERLADNPGGRGRIGEEAAGLLYDLDRDAEAADAFLAAAHDLHESGDLIGELRALRRRMGALYYSGDLDAALETAGLAGERFAVLPDEMATVPNAIWQNALTAWEHGRVLMSRGQFAEAVPVLADQASRLHAIGAGAEADRLTAMYGEALLRSGRVTEAEPVVRELLEGMAPDAPGRETTEKVYAEIVEALGTS
jgi:tetratricopeptide (TPR) repeat protein